MPDLNGFNGINVKAAAILKLVVAILKTEKNIDSLTAFYEQVWTEEHFPKVTCLFPDVNDCPKSWDLSASV